MDVHSNLGFVRLVKHMVNTMLPKWSGGQSNLSIPRGDEALGHSKVIEFQFLLFFVLYHIMNPHTNRSNHSSLVS